MPRSDGCAVEALREQRRRLECDSARCISGPLCYGALVYGVYSDIDAAVHTQSAAFVCTLLAHAPARAVWSLSESSLRSESATCEPHDEPLVCVESCTWTR